MAGPPQSHLVRIRLDFIVETLSCLRCGPCSETPPRCCAAQKVSRSRGGAGQ